MADALAASRSSAISTRAGRMGQRARMLLADRGAAAGLAFIAALIAIAVLAPLIAPYAPTAQDVASALRPPSAAHPLGTDEFGRDMLSRIIHGTRPALVIGLCSVAFASCIGTPLGLAAGFLGGWLDTAVSGAVDVLLSFPTLLLAILIVTLAGSGLPTVIVAIGFAQLPIFVRLARGSALVIRELDYVAASRTFGAGHWRILRRHVLPNALGPLIVMATLGIAGAIREEAGLSFLGLGVQPPDPSWGNLIRDGVNNILDAPWLALAPGLLLTASVLAFNIVGDAIRDILDPRDITGGAALRRDGP
jgi:ABC-type dipeptide/oligopeptide/nickel transport system permease subunit